MATWQVTTTVIYSWETEADSEAEAIAEGWNYEDHRFFASIDSVEVEELEEDEVEELEEDEV